MVRKRYCGIVAAIIIALVLVSCSKGGHLLDYQNTLSGASVRWEHNGNTYAADITLGESTVVTVTSPEDIAGLTVTYSDSGGEVSVGSVSFPLPDNTGKEVYRVVRSLVLTPDEIKGGGSGKDRTAVRFEVPLYDGITEYDIIYTDDGYPESATVTWDGGEMRVIYEEMMKE